MLGVEETVFNVTHPYMKPKARRTSMFLKIGGRKVAVGASRTNVDAANTADQRVHPICRVCLGPRRRLKPDMMVAPISAAHQKITSENV